MPIRAREHHGAALRALAFRGTSTGSLVRLFLLLAMALLPVYVRAGTGDPHPHALLQLLLDARDGAIDHHAQTGNPEHAHDDAASFDPEAPVPDVPTFEESGRLGGWMPLLVALVALLIFPASGDDRTWSISPPWRGCVAVPDLPPPRSGHH